MQLLIMQLDCRLQGQLLGFGALPGLAEQHIARTNERRGAQQGAWLAGAIGQQQQLMGRVVVHGGNHRGAQAVQHGAVFFQHRH